MKRIKAACLEQVIHFITREGDTSEYAKAAIKNEYATYKASLEKHGTKYKIINEETLPDGTIKVHVKRQNNDQPTGDFLK